MEARKEAERPQQAERDGGGGEEKTGKPQEALRCPRCESMDTKFCYYNNYSLSQPRHFCKACKRYWTQGGTLRNVPFGGGCKKGRNVPPFGAGSTPPPRLLEGFDPTYHHHNLQPPPPPPPPNSLMAAAHERMQQQMMLLNSSSLYNGGVLDHATSAAYYGAAGILPGGCSDSGMFLPAGGGGIVGLHLQQGFSSGLVNNLHGYTSYTAALQQQLQALHQQEKRVSQQVGDRIVLPTGTTLAAASSSLAARPRHGCQSTRAEAAAGPATTAPVVVTSTAAISNTVAVSAAPVDGAATVAAGAADVRGGPWSFPARFI